MGPGDLISSLCGLDLPSHPDLIVGLDKADDAGVYRLTDDLAIIQTVDFFAPIVDDPYTFGCIAAANSLSDVYAMGGTPITVLNIVSFPLKLMSIEILKEILAGGLDVTKEAGAVLVGGHTVEDSELKYGLSVTGTVHPKKVITNSGAAPGDNLVLTKAIGTGIIATALKGGVASQSAVDAMVNTMITLNRSAAEAAQAVGIRGATDVTGFSLLGHAVEMAEGSQVGMEIEADKVPLLEGVLGYADEGKVPGGANANRDFYGSRIEVESGENEAFLKTLYDPQTSGGLLLSVPEAKTDPFLSLLKDAGLSSASVIGRCTPPPVKVKLV